MNRQNRIICVLSDEPESKPDRFGDICSFVGLLAVVLVLGIALWMLEG